MPSATTAPKTSDEDSLVEWESAQPIPEKTKPEEEVTVAPKEDIGERKKTFHIHEDVEGAGKEPENQKVGVLPSPKSTDQSKAINVIPNEGDGEGIDILTTDTHSKPNEKYLGVGGKPAKEVQTETVDLEQQKGRTIPEMVEMVGNSPHKPQDEQFQPIGKDTKATSRLSEVEPATAPPNLKKTHAAKEELSNALEESIVAKKPQKFSRKS